MTDPSKLRFYQLVSLDTGERFTGPTADSLANQEDEWIEREESFEVYEACPTDNTCTILFTRLFMDKSDYVKTEGDE